MTNVADQSTCFLAVPYRTLSAAIRNAISTGARSAGYSVLTLDDSAILPGGTIQESILSAIASSDCVIADVSESNPNVFFELGLAQAMGKGILIIAEDLRYRDTPFDIREFRILTYSQTASSIASLHRRVRASLEEFRQLPPRQTMTSGVQSSVPFYVDWESLQPSEAENLCRELLSQLGFRRLDWGKGSPEIDLIAELPKRDPDGFEYKELWLVSMGLRAPLDVLIDTASHDTEYLLHRLMRYSDRFENAIERDYETSITLLLVLLRKGPYMDELEHFRERIERRSRKGRPGSSLRVRIWDQDYLTMLVHRFPSIGYKYFSIEGRIRSTTRKSYEQLYEENTSLVARLASLNESLQDEKSKRISAERDSVWKDISFSAAHKIGNPIFSIETDLDPLERRVIEGRTAEAEEVIANLRSSVEKAKSFVEQFKSLAKAQDIRPVPISLKPILDDHCKIANASGVICEVICADDVRVEGDPERLAECFDELIRNAIHWLDKDDKKILIEVHSPAPQPLPDFLDSSLSYVLIHFKDNGSGVSISDKDRIFDAFYTKRHHGTGLGLALVRRIIDGHKGGIIEVGVANKGADFEIFLPRDADSIAKQPSRRKRQSATELKDA